MERHSALIDPTSIDDRLTQSQKMNPSTVVVTETQETTELIETQYINLHRLPENLQKVQLVNDTLSNDLLNQQVVELASSNDFISQSGQYYEDEFLHHDLTEEDRRLAAALVAVQLVQQQKNSILTPELLKSNALPPLAPIQNLSSEKQPVTTAMVTSYLQEFEDESVQEQLMDATTSPERMLKIYQSQPVSASSAINVSTSTASSLNDIRLPALPPLKKVLSSQSMLRNRYDRTLNDQTTVDDDKDMILKTPEKHDKLDHSDRSGELVDNEVDSDFEGDINLKSSKRSLPHKKRIPRKLKQALRAAAKFKCLKCGDTFASHVALVAHRTSVHQRTVPFNCELCGFNSSNQIQFFEHLKAHYEPTVLQVADVLQPQDTYMEYEADADSNPPPILEEEESFDDPLKEGSDQPLICCNQCGRNFRAQKNYEDHLESHQPLEEFSEPEDMMEGIRHVVNIQTAGDDKEENSSRNWRLSDDLNNINPDIVLDSKGTSTDSLNDDMPEMETEKGKKKKKAIQCQHCSKTFIHRNSLLYHVRSHSGRRPHQCDVCGKGFFAANALRVWKHSLITHKRGHHAFPPHKNDWLNCIVW